MEPLELRRTFKVLTQTEDIRRLPGHPLHKMLAAPTKNRLKRQSLNHLAWDLRRTHEDFLNPQIKEETLLCTRDWNQEDLRATIFLEVPGLLPAEQHIPTQQMTLTLKMLEKYLQTGHTYTPTDQRKMLSEMEAEACLSGPLQDKVSDSKATGIMLKFQSRNLSTPKCRLLHETTEDCHLHRL